MDELARLKADVADLRGRARNATIVAGLCAAGVAWLGVREVGALYAGDGALVTREVVVVGDDGTVRARLGTTGLGDAQLTLSDPAGNERIWVKAGERHGTLEITDAERHALVRLSAVENLSGLHLANGEGAQTAQITASTENASVLLVDLDRSLMAHLRADPTGTDLELSRNPPGESPRLATLSAGAADPARGASLVLAGPQQFLQASVNPSDGEPRVVLAGETRLESRTGAKEQPWQRFERPTPEPAVETPAPP